MNKKIKILDAAKEKDILQAVAMIQEGKLVAVPTETVYGLAADARNVDAVKKIFTVKNRPSNHPLIVHISSLDKLSQWATDIPPIVEVLAKNFWPGPLTLLLKKNDKVDDIITGGLSTIAVRIPNNKPLLQVLNLLDTGLAAPSANPHKRISPTTPEHVIAGLSGKIDAVLDDGPCNIGLESTILDLTHHNIRILRHGPITKKMIETVIGFAIESPLIHEESVSGNMKTHYQPYTKTSLMSLSEIETQISLLGNGEKKIGIIHYSDLKIACEHIKTIQLSNNKEQYSKFLYHALHELDKINASQILVETPPHNDSWSDVFDRLLKACAVDDSSSR